ncbi:MAG: protease modulator HflC [Gammaproteobacteria bacterium]|nr:protease modulator HflC [Gammaproteobacteria bacterium]
MKLINIAIATIVIVIVLVLPFIFFTVNEGQNGLLLRLGKISTDSETQAPITLRPGLHIKIPFIDRIWIFDTRIQELATPSSQPLTVVTKEQTYLVVEYFAKWRINNLVKFYTSTGGSVSWAENLLEQRLNDIVRAEYGKRTSYQAISSDRAAMMSAIKEEANHVGKEQGIEVVDVRLQTITLPKDVMGSVFKRMEAERKQFAEAKRAEGMQKSEEVKALADQKVTVIKAEALMKAATIRAKGDQAAAEIYAKTYSTDPKFYAFYRSLQAYEQSFNHKRDILILKPEGQFFNYFRNAQGNGSAKKESS